MKTPVLLAPVLLAVISALPARGAESDYTPQSTVTLGLTISRTVPTLSPRDAAGKVIAGPKVFTNLYTDSRGNRVNETGSTVQRTRYSNREFLNDLKSRGIISTVTGYTVVRTHHDDDTGTYYLQRKVAGNQLERINISSYLSDTLPSMGKPVVQESGRIVQNAAGAEVSYSYSSTAYGGIGVEISTFPVPVGQTGTGAVSLLGSGSLSQRYVSGKGHSLSASVTSLTGGYSRVVGGTVAAAPDDNVLVEGSLTIAPATFVLNSALNGQSAGTGGVILSSGGVVTRTTPIASYGSNLSLSSPGNSSANLTISGNDLNSGAGTVSETLVTSGALTINGSLQVIGGNLTLNNANTYSSETFASSFFMQEIATVPAVGQFSLTYGDAPAQRATTPAANP